MNKRSIGIIGGGSWATALCKIIFDSGRDFSLTWYFRNEEDIDHLKKHRHNKKYLSSIEIRTEKIQFTSNINELIKNSEILILAIPAAFIEETFSTIDSNISDKFIISGVKGMIPNRNQIVGDYLHTAFQIPIHHIAILTGPCHAEEIALERLSYLTLASENKEFAKQTQALFQTHYCKINISDDIYGTEYAAVLKNLYAIASGISHGLAYGDNFQAVLISNAIREINNFVHVVHPIQRDIKSSAYLGDLLVTAYSKFSRNRIFGNMIGKGYSVKSALLEMNMIPEGYYALKSIYEMCAQKNITLPIIQSLNRIINESKPPAEEIKHLTTRLN
jgi:glycerol-3-phosphate dehydrogenase (NAD(P)+)